MRDFSLDIYRELLETLQVEGYELISYRDYIAKSEELRVKSEELRVKSEELRVKSEELRVKSEELRAKSEELRAKSEELRVKSEKLRAKSEELRAKSEELRAKSYVILRHDVDLKPANSLRTAQIEHALGAKATYYFRCGKESNQPEIIRSIAQLGHEIGYHYEDMSLCDGDIDKAWEHFQTWLAYFRQYYAVETICMHGAPTSRYDGKDLWKKYDYRTLGITGEPYLDTDFSDVFYLTDTGRCWDGYKVSVRDKIPEYQDQWTAQGLTWHTTPELIRAIKAGKLPKHVMITSHPQRWTNNAKEWYLELVTQNVKNIIKRIWIRN